MSQNVYNQKMSASPLTALYYELLLLKLLAIILYIKIQYSTKRNPKNLQIPVKVKNILQKGSLTMNSLEYYQT